MYCLSDLVLITINNSSELVLCNITDRLGLKEDVKEGSHLCTLLTSVCSIWFCCSSEPHEQVTENKVTEAKDRKATTHLGVRPSQDRLLHKS